MTILKEANNVNQSTQIITLHSKETAVLVPIAEWQRLQQKQPSLKDLLLAPITAGLELPERGQQSRRSIEL